MADIFGRLPLELAGAFSADSVYMSFGGMGGGGVGLLTQELRSQYHQEVRRFYDIGTRYVFYVVGRPRGQGQIMRVAGPRPLMLAFYQIYGNPCTCGPLLLQLGAGCSPAVSTIMLTSVLLTDVGFQAQYQQEMMLVYEQLSFEFVSMVL